MLGASAAAQSAADFIKQGNSDYDAKNYQAAVDDYSKAIAADSQQLPRLSQPSRCLLCIAQV